MVQLDLMAAFIEILVKQLLSSLMEILVDALLVIFKEILVQQVIIEVQVYLQAYLEMHQRKFLIHPVVKVGDWSFTTVKELAI